MVAWKVIGMIGLASYAIGYACARIPNLTYIRCRLVQVDCDALPDMPRGYTFRELSADDLGSHSIDASTQEQAHRFAQGFVCIGVFTPRGELAGVTWLTTQNHVEPTTGVLFVLPDRAAWDAGLWIPDNRRLGRAFPALWAAIALWLKARGLCCTISTIADYNAASIASHKRLGARSLGYLAVVRFFRFQLSFGARPFLVRLGSAHPPAVAIRPARP